MTARKIRVLVVEDSATVRAFLVQTFAAAPDMQVVGTAGDGLEAIEAVHRLRPDVVTMDITMPRMNGLDAVRRIMQDCPVPTVVVSATLASRGSPTFHALDAGALAFVRTPVAGDGGKVSRSTAELVQTVRLMSEVKVVRRRTSGGREAHGAGALSSPAAIAPHAIRVVAIGASTGGPAALVALLRALPKQDVTPILIVQHIALGFVGEFVRWLGHSTGQCVHVAVDGETLRPGNVFIAPDGYHMGVDRQGRVTLSAVAPERGLRPAVSYLFRAVREVYGGDAAAVLLSGMGTDGAKELLALNQAGSLTFAQDRASALVYGMPGEAVRLNAAKFVMEPETIGTTLAMLLAEGGNRRQPD